LVTQWESQTAESQLAVGWLSNNGVTKADLQTRFPQIGVVPRLDTIDSLIQGFISGQQGEYWLDIQNQQKFVKTYKEYFSEEILNARFGALVFPYHLYPNTVGRIQVRTDFLSKKPTKMRFHFVSPGQDSSHFTKRLAERNVGYFGLPYALKLNKGEKKLLATEGVSDLLAGYKAQLEATGGVISIPLIAIAGTGTEEQSFNQISSLGIEELWICQDSPEHKGDDVVKSYAAIAKDIDIRPLLWDNHKYKNVKDLRHLKQVFGAAELAAFILEESNFSSLSDYLCDLILQEIEKDSPGVEKQKKLIDEMCSRVASPSVAKAILNRLSEELPDLELGDIKNKVNSIINDDTVEGFMARVEAYILSKYTFLYRRFDKNSNSTQIVYKSNSNSRMVIEEKVCASWASTTAGVLISNDFGALNEWAQVLKAPTNLMYIQKGKVSTMRTPRGIYQEVKSCVEMVLSKISAAVPLMHDPFDGLGNGVHAVVYKDKECILVSNGQHRFIGTFVDSTPPSIQWEEYMPELSSNLTAVEWSQHLLKVDDLIEGNSINLRDVWDNIEKVINAGWTFKNQEEDTTWFTALSIYSAFYDFMTTTLLTNITANARSGKTKLVKHFFAGKQDAIETIMPCTNFFAYMDFPNTTEAGIRLAFSGSDGVVRRGLVLDEFEWMSKNPKSQATMTSLLDTCRSMLEGEALVNKGTKGGRNRQYNLRFPLITAGITEYRDDTGATESRMYRVELMHSKDRESPKHVVRSAFPDIDGQKITRDLTIGAFKWALKVREFSEQVYTRYERNDFIKRKMTVTSNDRSAMLLSVVGGVMMAAGFSDNEIENRLAKMLDKVCKSLDARTESVGDQMWQRLLSEKSPLSTEISGTIDYSMLSGSTSDKEWITLFDALSDESLIPHIGSRKFFPFVNYLADTETGEKYLLFDRYYLKPFLDKESLTWVQFKTQMDRAFDGLDDDTLRSVARRITGNSKYSKVDKKLCMVPIPGDITMYWSKKDVDADANSE
jgi:hypothetical protein